jgi:soluble lytic murein transglycosylase
MPGEVRQIAAAIVEECEQTGVDPLFVLAIIESESSFDIEAVSPTGARGLMQIVPSTFRQMSEAKRIFDPVENVRAGIRYVRHLWNSGFGKRGGPESVLLAYNQGPGAALAILKGTRQRPAEAQVYVPRVMNRYRALLSKYGHDPKDAKKLFLAMR